MPAAAARQQIRRLLDSANADNRQQTVNQLSALVIWYRDLLDEELIAAWQREPSSNLADVIQPMASSRVASAIVAYSWSGRRQGKFSPAYGPLFEYLMLHYADSAKPFLDDLLNSTEPGQPALDLSSSDVEAVCRILLDMPDLRTWKRSGLQILPHYRRVTENLLNRDLRGDDRDRSDRATVWLDALKVNSAGYRSVPNVPRPSATTHAGVVLTPLNPATVDDALASVTGTPPALIDFVNRSAGAVDIYWVDFKGDRVLYRSGLAVGATWRERTFVNHRWLVVASGTGGTTVQDTGTRLAGFEALTANRAFDPGLRDTAIITRPDVARSVGGRPTLAIAGQDTE